MPVDEGIAETKGANDCSGVDDRARANQGVLIQHDAWVDGHSLGQATASHDDSAAVNGRAGADDDVIANEGARLHLDILGELRARADACLW